MKLLVIVPAHLTDGWHITEMKVTKDREARSKSEVSPSVLRISFKTDRPIAGEARELVGEVPF